MTAAKNIIKDINSLPTQYQEFYHSIAQVIPKERIVVDPVLTYAYGVDASLYRMTPKIVVKTRNIEEVIELINEARKKKIALNFRGAGTSLCGQSLTNSVLVVMTEGWQNHLVTDNGNKITLQAGVLGSLANLYLKPYARKIGPDPASTSHAVIAGIASNNASGMCCGVADNSYHTLVDMKLVFMDGSVLDTADKNSCQNWKQMHKELIEELENIRNEIKKDSELGQLIAHKFKIKNTTGYALNSFVDYNDPIDVLKHLIIGSEGTLAVITEITYKTVIDHKYKASALMIFPDIKTACLAVMKLSRPLVFAAELLDRVSLKSVEDKDGIPSYIKDLPDKATALLVEIRTSEEKALYQQIDAVKDVLKDMHTLRPIEFTAVPKEYEVFWKIRSGIFPAVGGMREVGTTVIIEDVAFPKATLADAVTTLRKCMDDNGYSDGIIYGHALDGSVHFVFTQAFKTEKDRLQYKKFIEDICEFVVKQYDGSLKAEHGTGRNMAPFVKFEWGEKAYKIMQRIKKAFDPERMLNPDVIITDNYELFVENIKAMPKANDIIDKCIECGYCEAHCPSHNLTLSPRQRTATQREIARLELTGENNALMERFKDEFNYLGEQTCAVDGLCQLECPLSINTGDFTKYERSLHHQTEQSQHAAKFIDEHFAGVSSVMKLGLTGANVAHSIIGTAAMNYISKKLHNSSEGKIPQWTEWMPKSGHTPSNVLTAADADKPKIIYYPSCVTRMMGPAKKDYDQRQLNDVMLSLLKKAGYAVIIPKHLDKYCCGMPFESEGYFAIADSMSANLEKMLLEVTEDGKYPVLCDTSPCVYRMKKVMAKKLKIYDTVEFIYDCLLDKLHLEKTDKTVMLHITCSSRKMGDAEKFKAIAEACARKVVVPEKVHCCGFSGDKGFTNPELNQSALEHLNEAIPTNCTHGYSNSRTCEVGLSAKSGICYQSIAYLVDECAHN